MTTLPEHLHELLIKLRRAFDSDIPDPGELTHGGEVEGVTVRSSVPLNELTHESDEFTVYWHSKMSRGAEIIRYFHYEKARDFTNLDVLLIREADGVLKQQIQISTRPLDIVLAKINRILKMAAGGSPVVRPRQRQQRPRRPQASRRMMVPEPEASEEEE